MSNMDLITKFRPIFVFSKGEKYYPVSLDFFKNDNSDTDDMKINKDVLNTTSYPMEPLYYHKLDEDEEMLAIAYILIFPYSVGGFFGINKTLGDITSCVAVINKKTRTLKEVYFWSGGKQEYNLKTDRPVIFVSPNDHRFLKDTNEYAKDLRWEPNIVKDFDLQNMKNKKIEGKSFDYFLEVYDL